MKTRVELCVEVRTLSMHCALGQQSRPSGLVFHCLVNMLYFDMLWGICNISNNKLLDSITNELKSVVVFHDRSIKCRILFDDHLKTRNVGNVVDRIDDGLQIGRNDVGDKNTAVSCDQDKTREAPSTSQNSNR